MTWRIDFHKHSVFSDELERTIGKQPLNQACRRATPRRIIQNCETQGLNELAVTDSNGDLFFQRVLDKCFFGNGYFVEILPGENVARVMNEETGAVTYLLNGIEFHDNKQYSSGNGHLVVVGHKGSLMGKFERLNLDERVQLANESGGIWFFPHPCSEVAYGVGEKNVERVYEEFGRRLIIEGFNSQLYGPLNRDNTRAKELVRKLGVSGLANSDSNSGEVLSYNIFPDFPDGEIKDGREHVDYLKQEILNGNFETHEQLISPWSFFRDYVWEFGTRKVLES
jgi:hypothetical protein